MQYKIAVIEDDRIMRENISELLELTGYVVESAENGKLGVKLVKEFEPDLILCDVMMPELDGYGVIYILSKDPKTASIPFIFLTAKTERQDLRKGMNLGADDYLTKPFVEMDLLNAVEQRLKKMEQVKSQFGSQINNMDALLSEASDLSLIESLTESRKLYQYKADEFVHREGDLANFLFFLKKGMVKTYRLNDDMKELILQVFQPGEFIGYKALLEDRTYDEYAVAINEVELYKVPKSDFVNLIYSNQEVSAKFIQLLSKSLSEKEERLVQLAYDSVKKRTIVQIQKLNEESSGDKINVSRQDLSNLVGTSKETLVRVLTSLKQDGLIDSDGHYIKVLDKDGLDRLIDIS